MDKITETLKNVLTAAGVVYNLSFRIDENGRQCFIDAEGFEFCWQILPIEFTFGETIALGTPTLPSLEISIKNPDDEIVASMELPMPYAQMFLRTALKKIEHTYHDNIDNISNFVRMNEIHNTQVEKINLKSTTLPKVVNTDERDVF